MDICYDCIGKIKQLSIDKKDEEKYMQEVLDNARNYHDVDKKSAYYEGVEDALNVLSHKRLANIKSKQRINNQIVANI